MARSYQVNVTAATPALLADMKTLGGGAAITVLNSHASENLYIGGDENQAAPNAGGGSALTASTGLRIAAGQAYSVTINGNEAVYALSGNSTVSITAHVFRSNFKD